MIIVGTDALDQRAFVSSSRIRIGILPPNGRPKCWIGSELKVGSG
jgi:hypothetical protein